MAAKRKQSSNQAPLKIKNLTPDERARIKSADIKPRITKRREKWSGKFYSVARNQKGQFIKWQRWTPKKPLSALIIRKKYIRPAKPEEQGAIFSKQYKDSTLFSYKKPIRDDVCQLKATFKGICKNKQVYYIDGYSYIDNPNVPSRYERMLRTAKLSAFRLMPCSVESFQLMPGSIRFVYYVKNPEKSKNKRG
jgi:hypothetical protein